MFTISFDATNKKTHFSNVKETVASVEEGSFWHNENQESIQLTDRSND